MVLYLYYLPVLSCPIFMDQYHVGIR
uniref:Uncharacterized protein n=1 Tax=Rhizophora mucronata TaxID=61149 RepID=A0A2P2LD48_RHIMU